MNFKVYTISEFHKTFIWTPMKTASTSVSWIMGFFDFNHYIFENDKPIFLRGGINHFGHVLELPPNHSDLSFIVTTANPYDRIFSMYKMDNLLNKKNISEKNFENYLTTKIIEGKLWSWNISDNLNGRIPDYIVRKENLFSDLIQIPFIKNSKLKKSGILKDMCEKKLNSSFDFSQKNEILNKDNKEKIYQFLKSDFDFFGYEK